MRRRASETRSWKRRSSSSISVALDADHQHRLLAIPSRERLERVLRYMLDEREFLSPYGVRSLSAIHASQPFRLYLDHGSLLEVAKTLNERGWTTKRWKTRQNVTRGGFAYSKDNVDYRMLKPVLGEGLVTSDGAFWRRQRRLIQPAFHRERIAALGELMTARTAGAVKG